MNKRFSPAMIGAFVLGAVALIVIAILVFGSGRLFRQTREFVLYFDNSVNGLRIGAPVKIKGVEIGSVKDIRLQLEKDKEPNKIPVIIEVDLKKFISRGAASAPAVDREALRKRLLIAGFEGNSRWKAWLQGCSLSPSIFFRIPRLIWSSKQMAITNTRKSQPYPPPWSRPEVPWPGSSTNSKNSISRNWGRICKQPSKVSIAP